MRSFLIGILFFIVGITCLGGGADADSTDPLGLRWPRSDQLKIVRHKYRISDGRYLDSKMPDYQSCEDDCIYAYELVNFDFNNEEHRRSRGTFKYETIFSTIKEDPLGFFLPGSRTEVWVKRNQMDSIRRWQAELNDKNAPPSAERRKELKRYIKESKIGEYYGRNWRTYLSSYLGEDELPFLKAIPANYMFSVAEPLRGVLAHCLHSPDTYEGTTNVIPELFDYEAWTSGIYLRGPGGNASAVPSELRNIGYPGEREFVFATHEREFKDKLDYNNVKDLPITNIAKTQSELNAKTQSLRCEVNRYDYREIDLIATLAKSDSCHAECQRVNAVAGMCLPYQARSTTNFLGIQNQAQCIARGDVEWPLRKKLKSLMNGLDTVRDEETGISYYVAIDRLDQLLPDTKENAEPPFGYCNLSDMRLWHAKQGSSNPNDWGHACFCVRYVLEQPEADNTEMWCPDEQVGALKPTPSAAPSYGVPQASSTPATIPTTGVSMAPVATASPGNMSW